MDFSVHHIAITASDLERSTAFYAAFGFRTDFEWEAPDGSRRLRQMRLGDGMIELFAYPDSPPAGDPAPSNAIGLKHLALSTPDIRGALRSLKSLGLASPDVEAFDTPAGMTIAFIADPDGVSIELVEEHAPRSDR